MTCPGTVSSKESQSAHVGHEEYKQLTPLIALTDDPDRIPDVPILNPGMVVPLGSGVNREVLHWVVYVESTVSDQMQGKLIMTPL